MVMDTTNAEIIADSDMEIFVHDLAMLVSALVEPACTPHLLSVGKPTSEHKIKFAWDDDGGPPLTKPDGTVIRCHQGVNVPPIAAASAPKNVNEDGLPGIIALETTDDLPRRQRQTNPRCHF